MAVPIIDSKLFCACGVSYGIGTGKDLSSIAPFYANANFTATPLSIASVMLPQTAACLIGQVAEGIVIAFRGTEFSVISDWASDLLVEPETPPGFPAKTLIHGGFYLSVMEIMPGIIKNLTILLAANPDATVYITGHSKGGAMATIAAWYLTQISKTVAVANVVVTTFAAPATGNSVFASAYQAVINQTNYINYLDIVPFLPPGAFTNNLLITAITEYVTNTGLQKFLLALLSDFQRWNYTPCTATIQFIPQSGPIVESSLSDFSYPASQDLNAIIAKLESGDYIDVLSAHTYACGGGYVAAICPGICPAS